MHSLLKAGVAIALFSVHVALRASPIAAPDHLPTCIVQYSTWTGSGYTQRAVLYEVSGTYTELSVTYTSSYTSVIILDGSVVASSPVSPTTSTPPHRGSFAYHVDPQLPQHASIVYDGGGAGSLPTDQLYFGTPTMGSETSPDHLSTGFGDISFTFYPLQAGKGALNVSTRTTLTAGGSTITGFVIGGTGPTWVMIRAVGAGLSTFGLSPTVTQPSFVLYDSRPGTVGTSAGWGADPNLLSGYKVIASRVGAFPLSDNSDEGVLLVPLQPGAYTAVFSGNSSGQLLCEAYILPFAAEIP